ncbi:zinc finger C3H1 domain-containing protein isoform X2 [Denticeps clupeoides]|uniref:zinc finger C3H1 domain-containing protein isoform X2 n=1 Tax=Denticeps clupeoides TaxID=299321 RepID=UPI0010A51075|nr:zinc finger C3H1 domain-containing protein isoform X2 [Denticeps clupeoides]
MALTSICRSPREESELEDGEICDDETEEKQHQQPPPPLTQQDTRPGIPNPARGKRKPPGPPRTRPQAAGFRVLMPFPNRGPHLHGPFPPGHRPQIGPSGPDRTPPGQDCEPSPRSSFWERSHVTLGRLRGRGSWGRGGGGGREVGRPPGSRYPFGENHPVRKDSPQRKQKAFGRNPGRKLQYGTAAKPENGVDESFEDLLVKYKQIQLELECIRKEEKMALKPKDDSLEKDAASGSAAFPVPAAEVDYAGKEAAGELQPWPEKQEKKAFQAFSIKPLRRKLLTPAERDAVNTDMVLLPATKEGETRPAEAALEDEESESDLNISAVSEKDLAEAPVKGEKDEDDELSELQLRLLALQSASRKWQQKEQQVMKESKEKITRAKSSSSPPERSRMVTRSAAEKTRSAMLAPRPQEKGKAGAEKNKAGVKPHRGKKTISPGSVAKQAWRKQQLRTWKLEQDREQEELRLHQEEEDEERRRREDEIRKIRDLSNQDEQYKRFMKLVGAKHHTRSKSSETESRKSLSKQGLDISGSLYQYDNYDEVAMDTDSETCSPVLSPLPDPFSPEASAYLMHLSSHLVCLSPQKLDLGQQQLDQLGILATVPAPPLPPLPPPDEAEQPPKPPFANEEEEEEMLLREELLKSLANRRAVKPEESSRNSAPSSPPMKPAPQSVPRSNLAAVSLNTVIPQPRHGSSKFTRGHPVLRPPLVLPRHKSVVVQLNNSDSDSEADSSGSPTTADCFFGGLESMIKEARRTAEAAKPKASVSEKENNPMRVLEVKKLDHRLPRDELISRDKMRLSRLDAVRGVASPAGSDTEDVVGRTSELQLAEAEDKLNKHRTQLQKDDGLLKHLIQQELKKKESLKAAEAKVARLKEQLLTSEKIVSANRVLLKKLQEQMHRVQHRVTLKRHQAVKLERDLAQAKASVQSGPLKRKTTTSHFSVSKLQRLDVPPSTASGRHFAELIAQKQRLQQLESEYALKIQKLKEAQALRQQAEQRTAVPPPPTSAFPLPQPSLHDLTQDKLVLATEDTDADEEEQAAAAAPSASVAPAAAAPGPRRRSFRESGAFTKPKLQHPEAAVTSTPSKDGQKPETSPGASSLPELYLGLSVEELRMRYMQSPSMEQLLQDQLEALQGARRQRGTSGKMQVIQVDVDPMAASTSLGEMKPAPFGTYHSPLLVFKSYRFSPYFRTKEKLSLSSVSYSNIIEPRKCFCRFDLTGTCNDDECQWQHMRNCTFTGSQLFQDILSYNLSLIGCSESSTTEKISFATEKYIKKLFGANKDRMGTDQKAVLLVSKVNESKSHVPPFTTFKEKRVWRPEPQRPRPTDDESDSETEVLEEASQVHSESHSKTSWSDLDICVTQDDKRYFDSETDDISNLETSVLESPKDVQLWIKLAFKYLNQKDISATDCLDATLNTLSRALEDNRDNTEVWCHYLKLFSRRGSSEEVQEMCEMAVEYAPDYNVWWTFLNIERSFDGKDGVCGRLLQYLLDTTADDVELRSFHLLESLLYRAQLSLFTGKQQNALSIMQNALRSSDSKTIGDHLRPGDRALAWLCYIHMVEFSHLPPDLYDPADSKPGRVVCTDPVQLPWCSERGLRTPADQLIALFKDAIEHCTEEPASESNRVLPSLQLHTNLICLYRLLGRREEAAIYCESLLSLLPGCCPLLEILAELHLHAGHADRAIQVWQRALREDPCNAEIFYNMCKLLCAQECTGTIRPLFQEFMLSLVETDQTDLDPVDVLRHILGFSTQHDLRAPRVKEPLEEQVPHLSLIHCLWQVLHGGVPEAAAAFERALGSVLDLGAVRKLWLDYLLFTSSRVMGPQPAARDLRSFGDLVKRCLVSVPTRLTVPYSSARYWSCFTFHNQVVSFYLSCLPESQHSLVLERLRNSMLSNTELAIRLMQRERWDGNIEHLRLQARMLCGSQPSCLAGWKIAIAVEREQKGRSEVRRLYQKALQKLPLCASLWKDHLLFEATAGGKTDSLKKLVDKSQELGVSLSEPLSLGSSRAEGLEQ